MQDSAKGLLIAGITITLFILAMTSFIIQFPTDEGYNFSSGDNYTVNKINTINSGNTQLTDLNNNLDNGTNSWDITVGFMGTNTLKQGTKKSWTDYITNAWDNLVTLSKEVFNIAGEDNQTPVMIIIGIIGIGIAAYITLVVIKFIRTGN